MLGLIHLRISSSIISREAGMCWHIHDTFRFWNQGHDSSEQKTLL